MMTRPTAPLVALKIGRSAVLVIASLFLVTAKAEAASILDQSQLTIGSAGSYCVGGSITVLCGQSFTNGITGTLTQVDVYLEDAVGTPEAGLYDFSTASPTLLQASSTTLAFTTEGWYPFLFDFGVVAGSSLVFALEVMNGESIDINGVLLTDPYAGGQLTGYAGFYFGVADDDLTFATYVDPAPIPEPATLFLVGTGLAAAGVRWRRKNRR